MRRQFSPEKGWGQFNPVGTNWVIGAFEAKPNIICPCVWCEVTDGVWHQQPFNRQVHQCSGSSVVERQIAILYAII